MHVELVCYVIYLKFITPLRLARAHADILHDTYTYAHAFHINTPAVKLNMNNRRTNIMNVYSTLILILQTLSVRVHYIITS